MRRMLAVAIGLVALVLCAWAIAPAGAGAESPTGQITGQVTDARGAPLAGITVAAVPVANTDDLTQTTTDAAGRYVLDVPPGSYYVAFNTLDPVNDNYDNVTFGGPGPAAGAICTICGGQPVSVTAGSQTPAIGAALASSPFPQKGFVRPLSGKVIRVLAGRVTFNMGCHLEPTGCVGTARLRLGRSVANPVIATARVFVLPSRIGRLVFKLPRSVEDRLRRARRHALPALVEITARPSHTITRFELVER
jgi:hypothetical protein